MKSMPRNPKTQPIWRGSCERLPREREAITKQLLHGIVMCQASAEGRVEDVRLLLQEARR